MPETWPPTTVLTDSTTLYFPFSSKQNKDLQVHITGNPKHVICNILDIEKKSCIKLAIYTRVQENLQTIQK